MSGNAAYGFDSQNLRRPHQKEKSTPSLNTSIKMHSSYTSITLFFFQLRHQCVRGMPYFRAGRNEKTFLHFGQWLGQWENFPRNSSSPLGRGVVGRWTLISCSERKFKMMIDGHRAHTTITRNWECLLSKVKDFQNGFPFPDVFCVAGKLRRSRESNIRERVIRVGAVRIDLEVHLFHKLKTFV